MSGETSYKFALKDFFIFLKSASLLIMKNLMMEVIHKFLVYDWTSLAAANEIICNINGPVLMWLPFKIRHVKQIPLIVQYIFKNVNVNRETYCRKSLFADVDGNPQETVDSNLCLSDH